MVLKNVAFKHKLFRHGDVTQALTQVIDLFSSGTRVAYELRRTVRSDSGRSVIEGVALRDLESQTDLANTAVELWIDSDRGGFSLFLEEHDDWIVADAQGPDAEVVDSALDTLLRNFNAEDIRTLSELLSEAERQRIVRDHWDVIAPARLHELRSLSSPDFDFKKLIRLCEEININNREECYFATGMLTRALLDHVPPLFQAKFFSGLANYAGGSKSFKDTMLYLDTAAKKIADGLLHTQIRKKESLPNAQQVNFRAALDLLLAEIVRIMK